MIWYILIRNYIQEKFMPVKIDQYIQHNILGKCNMGYRISNILV